MPQLGTLYLACLAMLAFAGNSLLCRLALKYTAIDAASFTTIRLASGAAALLIIASFSKARLHRAGSWIAAIALLVYMACFSFAFTRIPASLGSLILFAAVQMTMMSYALFKGQRLNGRQLLGLLLAYAGLFSLFLPEIFTFSAQHAIAPPNKGGAFLMLLSGIAWGVYSLLGKNSDAPIIASKNNFIKASLFALLLSAASLTEAHYDRTGVFLAMIAGALTSGLGYAIWYHVLPRLSIATAAVIQLCVPVIAAFGGVILLDETIGLTFMISTMLIFGGTGLVIINFQSVRKQSKHDNGK